MPGPKDAADVEQKMAASSEAVSPKPAESEVPEVKVLRARGFEAVLGFWALL